MFTVRRSRVTSHCLGTDINMIHDTCYLVIPTAHILSTGPPASKTIRYEAFAHLPVVGGRRRGIGRGG